MTSEEATIPTQFTHSIKLSDTAKGIRIDVHVYANDKTTAIQQAFMMYLEAQEEAKASSIILAPVEVVSK